MSRSQKLAKNVFAQSWDTCRGQFFSGVRFKTHRNRPPNSQVKTCAFQNAPVRLPLKNSPLESIFNLRHEVQRRFYKSCFLSPSVSQDETKIGLAQFRIQDSGIAIEVQNHTFCWFWIEFRFIFGKYEAQSVWISMGNFEKPLSSAATEYRNMAKGIMFWLFP